MFKTSGNMRLVNDKELLISIWDSYTALDDLKQVIDMFGQIKLEEIKKESQLFSLYDISSLSNEEIMKNIPMYNFHVNISAPYEIPRLCENILRVLRETISKFM